MDKSEAQMVEFRVELSHLKERVDKHDVQMESIHELLATTRIMSADVTRLSGQVEALTKSFDERLSNHGKRIGDLENKPAKSWDKLIWAIGGVIVSGVGASIINAVLK